MRASISVAQLKATKRKRSGPPPLKPQLGFTAFLERYSISLHKFAAFCGGVEAGLSKSSLHRFCHGLGDPRSAERLKPILIEQIRRYLASERGKTPVEIELELNHVFTREELAAFDSEDMMMIAQRATLSPTVQSYFGLKRDPFYVGDPRNSSEVYTNSLIDRISAQVEDAINYQGFLVVIGQVGAGKSTLKRRTVETVNRSNGKMILLFPELRDMKKVQAVSITSFILESFEQSVPHRSLSRDEKLKRTLADLNEDGVRVALCFDECHRLDDPMLTALKNFWEIGTGGYDRYLGVVLFGQPQFENRLRDLRFREIVERIEVAHMPLMGKHAWEYVAHRVKQAGGDAEKLFERKAVEKLASQAETPLALGNLANAALIKAHDLGESKVLAAFINTANNEPMIRSVRSAAR